MKIDNNESVLLGPDSSPLVARLEFTIRPYDVDFGGIVGTVAYVRWLEDLRFELLNAIYPVDRMLDDGYGPLVVGTYVKSREPLRLLDQPTGDMWISEIGNVRWKVDARFRVGAKIMAEASQTGIFVDMKRDTPVRIPEAIVERVRADMRDNGVEDLPARLRKRPQTPRDPWELVE